MTTKHERLAVGTVPIWKLSDREMFFHTSGGNLTQTLPDGTVETLLSWGATAGPSSIWVYGPGFSYLVDAIDVVRFVCAQEGIEFPEETEGEQPHDR